jgi:hypothetical protein
VITDPPDRATKTVLATLANDTSEQIISGSFTPTSNGVIAVEIWAEYVAAVGSVTVDSVTVDQA